MTALLLIGVGRELERRVRRALDGRDLKLRQVYVLGALANRGGMGQRELGDLLGVDHSLLVTLLNPLETDDLIERRRSDEDRRRHQVLITAAGRRELKRALTTIEGVQEEFLASLDESAGTGLQESLWSVRQAYSTGGIPVG